MNIKGISGIAQCTTKCYVNLKIKLDDPDLDIVTTKAYVLPTIADKLPSTKIKPKSYLHDLADQHFNTPALVGVLLGSDVAANIFKTDVPAKITEDGWLMQPTHLGWIISGRGEVDKSRNDLSTFVTLHESILKAKRDTELNNKILKFYEVPEEAGDDENEIEYCEKIYQNHHYREEDGRYVVPTPWKIDAPKLGHSFRKAVKMFLKQEKLWKENSEHYKKSNEFMEEYLRLGHMTEIVDVKEKFNDSGSNHYLAYISICRKEALTTKLRNVFHASLPTSNGVSLNNTMYEGVKLQTEIFNVLTKARFFRFFFSADIEKMFRQINIVPRDRNKLRIIWRSSSEEPLREFELNTVTYGTDAAPWQAIRTIHQCAMDNTEDQPLINIIKNGFYVDDLIYGANTVIECRKLIHNIVTVLNQGKFPLTKWLSNEEDVLYEIPSHKKISNFVDKGALVKLLGLLYDNESDEFLLNFKQHDIIQFTKRGFLSIAASVYDPLGFMLPVTMRARLYVQKLWKQKYDWDDELPENLKSEFMIWYKDLEHLSNIRIKRWLNTTAEEEIELVGFSDASGVGRAAVIYSRVKKNETYCVNFIAAKGNVNKINTNIIIQSKQNTIPKNELDAIVILVDLIVKVRKVLDARNVILRIYTDSQVALSWIRNPSSNENKYIRRRVEKIKNRIDPSQIHYVKSSENPADPASRGLSGEQLQNCSLWFNGPTWLVNHELPDTQLNPEQSTQNFHTNLTKNNMFEHISKFTTLIRVIVFMTRWKHYKRFSLSMQISTNNYNHAPVTGNEVTQAKIVALKYFQKLHFGEDYEKISKKISLCKNNWLQKLSPFIDNRGLMCVGGRLGNADISDNQRHPIIVPPGQVTIMLIEYTHKANLHVRNSLTLQKIIEEYYIKSVKREIYHVLSKCTKCIRWKARVVQPIMSQLPKERVEIGGVFEKVGVDLAGPILIKASSLRTNKTFKVWIAVFVCLTTKAAHLEIVSGLSTEDFLSALTRMTSRRGPVKEIWSDNGTNFKGANRLLSEAWKIIVDNCIDRLSVQEINWKFIPCHSPTFGGLWEACVKSMKYFIKRMGSTTNLTYEQLHTLICRIEFLLNSRPLHPNPVDPCESLALTPMHFITSRGFKNLPTDVNNEKIPLTKKWLSIMQIQREFWEKFKTEYYYSLQKKQKWVKEHPNPVVGDVVLIKEPNVSPGEWKMGKIFKVYPDPHGTVRKAQVINSQQKESLRAINQLVPLNQEEKPASSPISPRIRRSQRISVSQVLITWLTLASISHALNYTTLSAGVHLHRFNDIYLKAIYINVVIETELNVTNDLLLIKASTDEIRNTCKNAINMPTVQSFCYNVSDIVDNRAQQIMEKIQNIYRIKSRNKRWVGILQSSKYLLKAAPVLLLTGGAIYQEYEISHLKGENEIIKERLRKASMILLNITELEHSETDQKLTAVIEVQKEANTINEINSYVNMIILVMDTILERHIQIMHIKPYKELKMKYETISKNMTNVIIPPEPDIFNIAKRHISISDSGQIKVEFKIPLVYRKKISRYGIINIPDQSGYMYEMHNKDNYFEILLNYDNSSYFISTKDDKITENIYNVSQWENNTNCLSMILHQNESADICALVYSPIVTNKIINMEDDLILTLAIDNVTAVCGNKEASFKVVAAVIYHPDCLISVGSKINYGSLHFNITQTNLPLYINPPSIKLSTFKPNYSEIKELKKELEDTLDSLPDSQSKKVSVSILVYLFFFLLAGLPTICFVILKFRKTRNNIDAIQQPHIWYGPKAEESHRLPDTAISLELKVN